MDGSIDIRLVLTVLGIVFSVAGAAAVARSQISRMQELLKDMETRMRNADTRVDKLETTVTAFVEKQEQRVGILAGMLSPGNQERHHREAADVLARLTVLERTQAKLEAKVGWGKE
tara:strand:- start:41058 stop:41405 length:348 start_codon:yes stop_codon:yes gene_type:complete